MSEVDDDGQLFYVDCLSRGVGSCDDGASVGVVGIDQVFLAVVN